METFSQSKIKAFRRCPKNYEYKYVQGLSRRTTPSQLARGVTFHEMLDAVAMGKDPMIPLANYRKEYNNLWNEEEGEYSSPEDILSLFNRYRKFYADDELDYGGRSEIEVQVEHQGIVFKGIIDKLAKDRQGRIFVMDHKTHKLIPDESVRFSDIQTILYYWAARESGEKVDGVLWDYIRTKPPTKPELLKRGGLSRRKDADVDYDTLLETIRENDLDPDDYREELERASKKVFFLRIKLPKPGEDLIKEVVGDFFHTARDIQDSTHFPRNMSRDCKMCSYYQICSAEVRGFDSESIRKMMFVTKPHAVKV